MIEVRQVYDATHQLRERARRVVAEVEKEICQGLEADWTAIAEGLETIAEEAALAAHRAWLVIGEAAGLEECGHVWRGRTCDLQPGHDGWHSADSETLWNPRLEREQAQ